MTKLDRELKEIMEDAFEQGGKLMKKIGPLIFDEEKDEDEKMTLLLQIVNDSKPKTFDDYIHDIKRAFIDDGWERTNDQN